MKKLVDVLNQMEQYLVAHEQLNPAVSAANAGWHIAHTLITVNTVVKAIQHSDPLQYKYQFNRNRLIIMTIGKIPRGRGRAPEIVKPKQPYTLHELQILLAQTKEAIEILPGLHRNQYFAHPYFDHLNVKPTIRFLAIHANHHLKIIADIVKK